MEKQNLLKFKNNFLYTNISVYFENMLLTAIEAQRV